MISMRCCATWIVRRHFTAGNSMTIANFSIATTDLISGFFAQTGGALPDDNTDMERFQAHLMVCVYARDASGVKAILTKHNAHRLIDSLRNPRYFPVHAAAASDNSSVLSALIDALPTDALNVRDESDRTPLMCAAEHGQIAAIHKLLAGKAAVDITDRSGHSALMRAAASGAVDAVKVLLGYEVYASEDDGAQPVGIDKQDNNGDTALILAIRVGHYDVVEALVARGANVNIANAKGERALSIAASLGRRRAVRLLCEHRNIDLNSADHKGVTVVMRAAEYADQAYDPSILNLLLGRNARTDLKDDHGCTVLLRAAKGGSDIAIEHLIAGGAEIHATDPEGRSAITLAVKYHNLYGLKYLLKQSGVWLDSRDHSGRTALFHAVDTESYEMVGELIRRGADINLSYPMIGGTVLALAQRRGNRRMLDLLLANGATREFKELAAIA